MYFSISKYGLGVSTDAVQLLFGAINLASGRGLVSYDSRFVLFWPPLYPALLALVRLVSGLDILAVALVVQAVSFIGLGIALALLFERIFAERWWLSAAAILLTQTGAVVLNAGDMVGSDYIHVFLVALLILLTARYVEGGSGTTFVGLALVAVLTPMQRYLGVAATATAAASIVALGPGRLVQRVVRAALIGFTVLPTGLWLAVTSQLYTRRGPISFEENFTWFTRSLLEWFVGPISRKTDLTVETAVFWSVLPALAILVLWLAWRERPSRHPGEDRPAGTRAPWLYILVLWGYGASYTLVLFAAASVAYFNKLGGRFLLPLYLPLLALPVLGADRLVGLVGRLGSRGALLSTRLVCAVVLIALGAVTLRLTYPEVMQSHAHGVSSPDNAYNNERWRENPALEYWKGHIPDGEFLMFSNEPDGVAFFTRRAAKPAPRRISGPYGTSVMPISDFRRELFAVGPEAYLIWIEPSSYDYYYSPQQLEEIAHVESLFNSDLGSVYRLSPRGED